MQAVAGSQILILQLFLYFHFRSLHMLQIHSSVLCLWFLYLQILQKSRHFYFPAWPKKPKDCSGCAHHDDIAALLKCNYPCRRGIFWSHVESIVIMIQPSIQVHTPLHTTILRDHVILILVIGLLRRYNITYYYCWAEKLMLRRN